ncbi:hypothetical protein LUZ60_018909 [Juncus effusus]|nr:hypothetical protein LUZ60_018909 [Juncus effusus]
MKLRALPVLCVLQTIFLHITISLESIIFYEKLLNSITCCRRAFPIDIGISVPETMVSPIIAPLGCKIYLFSPSP